MPDIDRREAPRHVGALGELFQVPERRQKPNG